jgi:hypothetical protein
MKHMLVEKLHPHIDNRIEIRPRIASERAVRIE